MKLIRRSADGLAFQLGGREKELLTEILGLYPRIPAAYQPLSKVPGLEKSSQQLLNEALAEQRRENQKQVQGLLSVAGRFERNEQGWKVSLTSGEVEQLLQILNDVRVGSWLSLGSPESPLAILDEKMAPHFWAMEMAGYFQMRFLEILEGREEPDAESGSQL